MSDNSSEPRVAVDLPEHVVEDIEGRLPETRFDSVDDYAATALALLLAKVTRDEGEGDLDPDDVEQEDDPAIRRQLESLGYL